MDYPFEYIDLFLTTVEFSREPDLPPGQKLQFEVQVKSILEKFPDQIQISIRLFNSKPSPLYIRMEMVGLFKYTGNNPDEDVKLVEEFMFAEAVPSLIPTLLPTVRSIGANMGVHGINLTWPGKYKFKPVKTT